MIEFACCFVEAATIDDAEVCNGTPPPWVVEMDDDMSDDELVRVDAFVSVERNRTITRRGDWVGAGKLRKRYVSLTENGSWWLPWLRLRLLGVPSLLLVRPCSASTFPEEEGGEVGGSSSPGREGEGKDSSDDD